MRWRSCQPVIGLTERLNILSPLSSLLKATKVLNSQPRFQRAILLCLRLFQKSALRTSLLTLTSMTILLITFSSLFLSENLTALVSPSVLSSTRFLLSLLLPKMWCVFLNQAVLEVRYPGLKLKPTLLLETRTLATLICIQATTHFLPLERNTKRKACLEERLRNW